MKRFEILKGMHLGPLMQNVKPGDVLAYDKATSTLLLNGTKVEEAKGMDFQRAIETLERQIEKQPNDPWSKELNPVSFSAEHLEIKTKTQVVLPILGCLQAVEEYLDKSENKKVEWTAHNEEQYQFLKRFLESKSVVEALGNNLRRKADRDSEVINAWLKENGFDIQLNKNRDRSFCVASILDVLVEWFKEGRISSVYNERGTFPAVTVKNDNGTVFSFLDRELHPFPIASLRTKNGDQVFMSVLDCIADDTFAISDKVDKLKKVVEGRNSPGFCDGVVFPMIDYNQKVDITWLREMATGPLTDDFFIEQALQQTKFQMNEKGAHVQSAVAMELKMRCCVAHDHWIRIDRPFILWIERPGIPVPMFAGVFAEDVWKKPAE